MIYSVWIINKSGGLSYQRTFAEGLHPSLSSNDCLMIASTLQGVYAITANVSPIPGSNAAEVIEWQCGDHPFSIHTLHTPTNLKIMLMTSPGHPSCDALLKRIYQTYADYALKNPFQLPEMPVKSELFESKISKIVS